METLCLSWFLLTLTLTMVQGQASCPQLEPDHKIGNREYFYSWNIDPRGRWDWQGAADFCKSICAYPLSIEDKATWEMVKEVFAQTEGMKYLWTSGRKCNFDPCQKYDYLQPAIENGWFWQLGNKKIRIPNPFENSCDHCEWSHTGFFKRRQPDNRDYHRKKGDEGCIAILNNLYEDGLKWHDVACRHKKAIICQKPHRGSKLFWI